MRKVALTVALSAGLVLPAAASADAAVKPKVYKNCAALNKDYRHGVGRDAKVRDRVRGSTRPVTTFVVNQKVYDLNKARLDADRDGIACEKR